MEFYWRKVACLGKRGEVIKTVCCTDNHPKPWAILLPTKHKVKCSKPNCKSTCYSEIIKIREKKFFNQQPQSHLIDERDKKNKLFSKKSRDCSKGVSFNSHTVPIPEIILELIDLCNFLNNSNILQFEKLNSFCKMKNMNLDDFLNHVNYKGRTSYGLDESNFKRQKDGDENFENKSYDEIALEMKDTNLIQPILENYLTSENYFETTNKIKNIPKSGRKRTYVATTNAIYNHQSTFKDNESNKFPILELNSIMNGLFPLKYEFLNIHLMHTTGKTSTSYYCDNYCDEEDIFETTTSSATSTDTTATTTSTDTTTASTATASTTIATTATASTTTASTTTATTTATTATAGTTTASTTSSTTIATKKICVEIEETSNNCCCNCKKNRKTHNKKKLSNLLFAFLRGPRPTFANHDAMHSTTFTKQVFSLFGGPLADRCMGNRAMGPPSPQLTIGRPTR